MRARPASVVACIRVLAVAAVALLGTGADRDDTVQVAVASNFAPAMQQLGDAFQAATGIRTVVSTGSTGMLYAQITSGAPFEVFLAADAATPERLVREGLAVDADVFTYAVGRLALWSADPDRVDARGEVLRKGNFRRLALANPEIAPYGAAAREALRALGLWNALQPRLVFGENVAQTFSFVASGNAELGFVALSQLQPIAATDAGSRWIVPPDLYPTIEQQAVLLDRGRGRSAAEAFVTFLRAPTARTIIERFGYEPR